MGARHQSGRLFVPDLDEFGVISRPTERTKDAVDSVARIAKETLDSPLLETRDEEITDLFRHHHAPLAREKRRMRPYQQRPIDAARNTSLLIARRLPTSPLTSGSMVSPKANHQALECP